MRTPKCIDLKYLSVFLCKLNFNFFFQFGHRHIFKFFANRTFFLSTYILIITDWFVSYYAILKLYFKSILTKEY